MSAGWSIDKLGRTLAALVIFTAAYLAEVLRGGLQGVEGGQTEASDALGITYWKRVWYIVLPQAIQKVIPPLTNTAIVMVKNTSLVILVGGVRHARREPLGRVRPAMAGAVHRGVSLRRGDLLRHLLRHLDLLALARAGRRIARSYA